MSLPDQGLSTPLHWACRYGHETAVQLLLQAAPKTLLSQHCFQHCFLLRVDGVTSPLHAHCSARRPVQMWMVATCLGPRTCT